MFAQWCNWPERRLAAVLTNHATERTWSVISALCCVLSYGSDPLRSQLNRSFWSAQYRRISFYELKANIIVICDEYIESNYLWHTFAPVCCCTVSLWYSTDADVVICRLLTATPDGLIPGLVARIGVPETAGPTSVVTSRSARGSHPLALILLLAGTLSTTVTEGNIPVGTELGDSTLPMPLWGTSELSPILKPLKHLLMYLAGEIWINWYSNKMMNVILACYHSAPLLICIMANLLSLCDLMLNKQKKINIIRRLDDHVTTSIQ